MIVGNLNFHGALLCPAKAHTPSVVDTDAVLAFPIARQGFEAMRRWNPKIGQRGGRHDTLKPHAGSALDVIRKPANVLTLKDTFGLFVLESLYEHIVTHRDNNANGYGPC